MKGKLHLSHRSDYNEAMDLLTDLLSKITFELSEQSGSRKKTDWRNLIFHTKSYPRMPQIKLIENPNKSFSKLLAKRRSVRKFAAGYKIELKTISKILSNIKNGSQTKYPERAFPSAGALYPSNTYCVITNGLDLENGLYFYNHNINSLECLLRKDLRQEMSKSIADKTISNPSVIFILTNSYYKSCLKYGARGFLYSLMEIGALAQTLNLACIENGLDCVWLGGFADHLVKNILDINDDLEIEIPVLLIAAGKENK